MIRFLRPAKVRAAGTASVSQPPSRGPVIAARNFHKYYDAAREEQTFSLADGRTIGFAEYGDLQGIPAFCLHGGPGSRYDGSGFVDLGKKLNVRFVCPDRPGHGLSTFQADRKLGDYPNDIRRLARQLGLPKYHVFGISGGGPFAVACAHGLPKDELLTAAVIAGGGPPETMTIRQAGLYSVIVTGMGRHMPGVLRYLVQQALTRDPDFKQVTKSLSRILPKEDRAELQDPFMQALTVASMKEAYAQRPDGPLQDAQICDSPWDFRLEDVDKEVKLFYGHKDTRTPIAIGRYYKEHLPKAELIEFEDAGHLTIFKHEEQIMRKILGFEEVPEGAGPPATA